MEKVTGTSVWLLVNDGESDAEDGVRNYLQVYYGTADVRSVPQEGHYATMYYHDEVYGTVTSVDEYALAAAANTGGPTFSVASAGEPALMLAADIEPSESTDSPDMPGYIELGDQYDDLNYGNELFHVADVIVGLLDDDPYDLPIAPATPTESAPEDVPKKGAIPATGDQLAGWGGLLAPLGIAGAALTAYSARRVANEEQDAE